MQRIVKASVLYRALFALCLWFGRQWQGSGVIQWFLHPPIRLERAESESSVFTRLWRCVHRGLCRIYEALHLRKLFAGSVFQKCWLWAGAAAALAPILPTMAVLGLMLVSCFSLLLLVMEQRELELFYTPYNRYIWMYAAIYLVGTWFSVTRSGSLLGGCLTVAFTLFALVLENSITTRKQLDTLILLLVLAGTAVALYGICQYIFGWGYQSDAWVDSDMFSSITFRVTATLENPNMLGQYLILVIALGGAGLLSAKGWGMRVVYFCCCGIMCVCMLLTFARGAWLGLLFAGLVFLMFLQPRLLLLTPLFVVALFFVLPDTVIERFTSIGNLGDQSTSYRVYIWMGTLAMLKDYWLCGIGPGTEAFNLVYPLYSLGTADAQHSHSLYLQTLCDGGVFTLFAFLATQLSLARVLCVSLTKKLDWQMKLWLVAILAGLAGLLVQGATDYSFYNYRVALMFWAFVGTGISAGRLAWKEARA